MEVSGEQDEVDWVVLGIGLNVNTEFSELPVALRRTATSLKMATGEAVDRSDVLATLLLSLEAHYHDAVRRASRARCTAFRERDYLLARTVSVETRAGAGRRRRRRHRRPRRAARGAAAPPRAQLPLRRRHAASLSRGAGGPRTGVRFDGRPGAGYIVTSSPHREVDDCPGSPPESSRTPRSSRRSSRSRAFVADPGRLRPLHAAGVRRAARRPGARRPRSARSASLAYLILGLFAPVYAGGASGLGVLFGPTGGYLLGFVGAVIVPGLIAGAAERTLSALAARRPGRARADLRARRDVARAAARPERRPRPCSRASCRSCGWTC